MTQSRTVIEQTERSLALHLVLFLLVLSLLFLLLIFILILVPRLDSRTGAAGIG
jgi:hypothetical protein